MEEDKKKEKKYYSSVKDYQVLEDIEHVRKRPGNYIGSTDEHGWHHLFQEIIDNSIDEAVAGNCDEIKVVLSDNQKSLTVEDNGLGIAMGIHPKTNQSVLVTLFSCLKSGGKFSDKVYKTSGGLHGLGVTIVNALSLELKVWNRRQGKTQAAEFNRGVLKNEQIFENKGEPDGLTVFFTPDPLIFKEFSYFRVDIISNRLKELSYLNPKLTIIFQYSSQKSSLVFCNSGGLSGLIKELVQDNALSGTSVCFEEQFQPDPYFYLSFAWQYLNTSSRVYSIKSFCNNINTSGGGTHVEGFESGLVGAFKDWIKDKYSQIKVGILKEDVLEGLFVVLSIRMKEPQFSGQTKSSLSDKYVRELVKTAVYGLTKRFLQDNSGIAEIVSQRIITSAQNRTKTEEYHSSLKDSGRGLILPGKLTPCISKNAEETFLFLVEGDSAGGSAKLARNPNIQAILPLKGKILNIEKAEAKRVFANEEIKNVVNALGLSVSEAAQNYYNRFRSKLDEFDWNTVTGLPEDFIYYNEKGEEQKILAHTRLNREQVSLIVKQSKKRLLEKIRYGKIIIMADADPDGNHIESLELTFFICFFRYLIEEGRLFLAVPPLYRWKSKKAVRYFFNEWELRQCQKESGLVGGGHLQRFKGLGEMDPVDLRETTMDPEKSRFYKILLTDVPKTYKVVDDLMGSDSESRRRYLESGEYKNAVLEVTEDEVELHHTLLVKFLTYAHEVVEERALPEEDGLKPVQRRILYTCRELGLLPGSAYRKSSKIAGDVMGDFHPHGTEAIYQAMVKMAQKFNYRYPLINGQGNWGSIDGDSPAQMRYTEAKLTAFGAFLLEDLSFSNTIEWRDNYDNTKKEPKILPPCLNLLLNGSCGIAVGMNTNIPPHNLREVAEAAIYLVENPEASLDDLLKFLPAPDFPTGGEILESWELKKIYESGEGTIFVRARTELLENSNPNKKPDTIRIYEIPFKVAKSKLVESISEIIREKKIEGLKNVEDYSNLEKPVNIHLRFDSNYDAEVILNQLFKHTKLQSTFSVKFRVLINGKPKLLTLLESLQNFVKSRLDFLKKKAFFIFQRNQKELGELELRCFIIDNYKKIVEIISQSVSEEEIKEKINSSFCLTKEKLERLLDIPSTFRQFTPERKKKLEEEIERLKLLNIQQQLFIDNEGSRRGLLVEELEKLKKSYFSDERRTIISERAHQISERQLVPFEERLVILSYIKGRNKINSYLTVNSLSFLEATNIPSQGKELRLRGDAFWSIMRLNRRDDLWLFTNYGRVYVLNFFKLMGINRTFNLDEEYFVRGKIGEANSFLRPSEFFISSLVVGENPAADSLLLITKSGKIKIFRLSTLINKIGRSGRQLLPTKKSIIRCNIHQEKLENHVQDTSHKCGVFCVTSRILRQEVNKCSNCQVFFQETNDEIFQAVLVKDGDIAEVVVKRRSVSGNIKNQKVSLYRSVRIKTEIVFDEKKVVTSKFCEKHQSLVFIHVSKHQQEKTICSIRCSDLKNFQKEIKICSTCQESRFFVKVWKRHIRGERMVGVVVFHPQSKDSILLLVRNDNSLEKKTFSLEKKFLGMDGKLRKTNYCKKHWIELDSLNKTREQAVFSCQEERNNLENCIVNSPLIISEKERLVKKFKLSETKELFKRISNSLVDVLISQEVIDEQTNRILQIARGYQKFLQMRQNIKNKLEELREQMKSCSGCQKYCDEHQKKLSSHAEECSYCFSSENVEKGTSMINEDIELIRDQLSSDKVANKVELERVLSALKKKREQINKKSFSLRQTCPVLSEFRGINNRCVNCQKQSQKKYLSNIDNPIERVFLIDNVKSEIYLLTRDKAACLYNKKDLEQFMTSDSRSKILLRDKSRSIAYINVGNK